MQGRLIFRNDNEKARATRIGITDLKRKYALDDLAHGDVMFSATGVTSGAMLQGVRRFAGGAITHSVRDAFEKRHRAHDRGTPQFS